MHQPKATVNYLTRAYSKGALHLMLVMSNDCETGVCNFPHARSESCAQLRAIAQFKRQKNVLTTSQGMGGPAGGQQQVGTFQLLAEGQKDTRCRSVGPQHALVAGPLWSSVGGGPHYMVHPLAVCIHSSVHMVAGPWLQVAPSWVEVR